MQSFQNRRRFLAGLTAAGAAGLVGAPKSSRAEPPPEVTRVRLPLFANVSDCQVPEFVSTDLLHAEGFTDVQFVEKGTGLDSADWLGRDEIDFDWNFPPALVRAIANGLPTKVLAGMHGGCLELFANDSIGSVKELKGKRVGVDVANGTWHLMLIVIAANVGLDPYNDVQWTTAVDPIKSFETGEIDAFLSGPPYPQQMRARKLGHSILRTIDDRPWSQYFCCMVSGTPAFVERYPVATKRVLRALLKSVDLCITDPERIARLAVEKGVAANYEFLLQAFKEVRYDRWREFEPEDSIRFYALRMLESGIIQESPQEIIAKGTDWRFLNELKRELKT